MVAKFFVWGEGVWRELDVASGRVSGWRRRARFVFVRRGRLMVARRRPVLQALDALAARQPSAAADGPRLAQYSKSGVSHRRPKRAPSPAPPLLPAACEHHHCCAHAHVNGYYNTGRVAQHHPATPAITATPTTPTTHARMREAGTQCGQREAGTQCSQREAGTQRDAGTCTERRTAVTISVCYKHKPAAAAAAPAAPAATRTSTSEDEFVSTYVGKPAPAARNSTSEVSALLGKPIKPEPTSLERSSDDLRERKQRRKRARAPITDKSDSTSADQRVPDACKELIIPEDHVSALRGFVARTRPSALARFDADESYKCALFYAINPLVELQRCARLERLLGERGAVTQFAARLGLAPSPRSADPAALHREQSAETDADKENKDKHTSPNKVRSEPAALPKSPAEARAVGSGPRQGVSERSNKEDKKAVEIKAPQTNGIVSDPPRAKRRAASSLARAKKKALLVSDGGGDAGPAAGAAGAPPAGTHVISKRASASGAKEYSNLEDHAIVAWVSIGSRASLVNGNRVWRDLQEQYERLTGCARSWHSLRNRYLRYILPALGALRLPPADVSRLRAAAATGAIRTKQRAAAGLVPDEAGARRNSLFKEAPRGASSRRPRSATSGEDGAATAADNDASHGGGSPARRLRAQEGGSKDTSTKDESSKESDRTRAAGKPRSPRSPRCPRYSEVTRRFAARRPRLPSSGEETSRSPSPAPAPAPAPLTRSRRLFNPNSNV